MLDDEKFMKIEAEKAKDEALANPPPEVDPDAELIAQIE